MEDALEVLDLLADLGYAGAAKWTLRLLGLFVIFATVGAYFVVELSLLLVGVGVFVGLVLLLAPNVLLFVAELV